MSFDSAGRDHILLCIYQAGVSGSVGKHSCIETDTENSVPARCTGLRPLQRLVYAKKAGIADGEVG